MSDLFLTNEELNDLTGYRIKSKHIQYLREIGLPFFISASGHPRVARVHITGHKEVQRKKPNFKGLSRAQS